MKVENVVYMINSGCNFRCKFCLNNWKYDNTPMSNLSFDEKIKILNKIKELGSKNLTISGGEPLLDNRLSDLIRHASDLGLNVNLLTNGSLLTEEFLDKVKDTLESIQVSLEGIKEIHNTLTETQSYDKVVNNIKIVKSKGIKLMTNFTITKLNYKNLEEYVLLLKELKIDVVNFTRIYPSGYGKKNWKELMIEIKEYEEFVKKLNEIATENKNIKFRLAGPTPMCLLEKNKIKLEFNTCGAGVDELAINPNGDILPCPSWPKGIGNLLKNNFEEILENKEMKKIVNRTELNSTCKSCNHFSKCKGGCLLHVIENSDRKDVYMVKAIS